MNQVYGTKQCRFFKWLDEVDYAAEVRDDKLVGVLSRKIVELRKTQRQLLLGLGICIISLLLVVVLYVAK